MDILNHNTRITGHKTFCNGWQHSFQWILIEGHKWILPLVDTIFLNHFPCSNSDNKPICRQFTVGAKLNLTFNESAEENQMKMFVYFLRVFRIKVSTTSLAESVSHLVNSEESPVFTNQNYLTWDWLFHLDVICWLLTITKRKNSVPGGKSENH